MKALTVISQTILALAFSGTMALWLGTAYLVVGVIVMVTCGILFVAAEPFDQNREFMWSALSATILGIIWPAIPLMIAWSAFGTRENPPRAT